jgi:DNA modification methylase/predicted RNA-binding Zn-ribbon protein involved in translation (DUF1610 family)
MKPFPQIITSPKSTQPVTCLGLSFDDNEARRSYFLDLLSDQLKNSEDYQNFPETTDKKHILALSDPPYYTVCPNPWLIAGLEAEVQKKPTASYHREPFAADVSEGKNDPIYSAHSYHTKVPHQAIMRYILHYTNPGDVVFDSFCGTGMTGVAAQLCGDQSAVEALGYQVQPDGTIEQQTENDKGQLVWKAFSQLGPRYSILNDLSPTATFIAYNYNTSVDVIAFEQEAKRILHEVETEWHWMYQTVHSCTKNTEQFADDIKQVVLGEKDCPAWMMLGQVNYTVWSEVFICPECSNEVIFWEVAVESQGKIKKTFLCPHCAAELTKRSVERAFITQLDGVIGETIQQVKQVPVLINYSIGQQRFEKKPDQFDFAVLEKIEQSEIPYWFPTQRMKAGDESRRNDRLGITHLHHFYTKRSLWQLSALLQKTMQLESQALRSRCRFLFQQWAIGFSKLNRYSPTHFSQNNRNLSGTLYIGSQIAEVSPSYAFTDKIKRLKTAFGKPHPTTAWISTQSATQFELPDNCMDYIFIDPPFGSNIMYSELNFLWEGWAQIFTNHEQEAIVNKTQKKQLSDYHGLMVKSFKEAFRLLKSGRWMTVEFSNTQAKVWNTIQTALQEAGFVIANVSALDKKQGSFKAVTTTTAVKQDLIISAYKPEQQLIQSAKKAIASEDAIWEFVNNHLKYLPLTKKQGGEIAFIAEREPRILYDRTVAYFINQGYLVPLSSQAFQAGLREHCKERDGMIFRLDQVAAYEQTRKQKAPPQLELFVSDERSAIDWLQHFLKKCPATYQEIHPHWTKLIGAGWKSYEPLPELDTLLALNFLKYDGFDEVPLQIHDYLARHFEACRDLPADAPLLKQRATDRWYVPELTQAIDVEKRRENHLLREFKQYCQSKKRLKAFRLEAMRIGFKKAWEQKDYQTIIDMANKIPESVLYEDEKLLQLYDLAQVRMNHTD